MNKIFLLLFFPIILLAADLSITGVEVGEEGWNAYITIANASEGGTFLIDHGTNHTHTANTPWLYVERKSLDTLLQEYFTYDTVYIDTIVDKTTPNAGTDSTYVSGSDIVVLVALSDFICIADTIRGASIASNFYTNGADATIPYTSFSETNSSTQTYPKAFMSWATPDRLRHKGDSFTLTAKCGSYWGRNGRPVYAVMFRVVDENGNRDSIFTLATSADMFRFTDAFYPKNDSICDEVFSATFDNTQFTSGDTLLCDAYVIPWVGEESEVLKTDDGVFDENSQNYHTLVHLNDRDLAYGTTVACLDTLNGDDGTAAVVDSASFDPASPPNKYKNLHAAANAIAAYNNTNYSHNDPGGGIIYAYTDLVYTGGTVTTRNTPNKTYIQLRPAPDTAFGYLHFKRNTGSKYIGSRMKVTGMALDTAIAAGYFGGGTHILWFDSCVIDVEENTLLYDNELTYVINSLVKLNSRGFKSFGTVGDKFPIIRGNYFYGTNAPNQFQVFSGNIADSCLSSFSFIDTTLNVERGRGTFLECNKIIKWNGGGSMLAQLREDHADSSGHSISMNLVENRSYQAVPQPLFWIAADGSVGDLKQFIVANNVLTGWRANSFYNDAGTSPVYRIFVRQLNNLYEDDNIKMDDFGTMNPNRVGNWSVAYRVGSSGNINAEQDVGADGFLYRFAGASGIQEPKFQADDSTYFKFVDRKSWNPATTITNEGGGDYHLTATSPAIGLATTQYFTYDLDGNERGIVGASGVFADTSEFPITPQPDLIHHKTRRRRMAGFRW